jgi:sortase A
MKRILLNLYKNAKNPKRIVFFIAIVIVAFLAIYTASYYESKEAGIEIRELPEESGDLISEAFTLKINKLNIVTPVIENVDGGNKKRYNEALKSGVAHYKGTALPGEESNIFIFGHSSSYVGLGGDYGEIFKELNNMESGDEILIIYQDKEYIYKVVEKKVVEKTEVSVLNSTDGEQLTLMTCWPIGTNLKRLIVIAKP